ncbi:hypothetical protein KQX54_004218 [Cotesia glomerata]|uniref:Uncharacterized protein n=1 Tax=Cotesia glomerata TaxID=32391 RepID=A0AAV7ICR0_COTGL|nr:hypothetical protein KQX54_004218 [Cotesia glomerata]
MLMVVRKGVAALQKVRLDLAADRSCIACLAKLFQKRFSKSIYGLLPDSPHCPAIVLFVPRELSTAGPFASLKLFVQGPYCDRKLYGCL